jgi:hypothetical protein
MTAAGAVKLARLRAENGRLREELGALEAARRGAR